MRLKFRLLMGLFASTCIANFNLPVLAAEGPDTLYKLEAPVAIASRKTSLDAVLTSISTQCGLKLTCADELRDEPVLVVCRSSAAGDCLRNIAMLMDSAWQFDRKTGAYQLVLSERKSAAQREELRTAEATLLNRLRVASDQLTATVRSDAGEMPRPPQDAPDGQGMLEQPAFSTDLKRPGIKEFAILLSQLAPNDWHQLGKQGEITWGSRSRPGSRLLPVEIERSLRSIGQAVTGNSGGSDAGERDGGGLTVRQLQDRWSGAESIRVHALWIRRPKLQGPSAEFRMMAGAVDKSGREWISSSLQLRWSSTCTEDLQETAIAPELLDAISHLPKQKVTFAPSTETAQPAGMMRAGEFLFQMASQYGCSVYAHAYSLENSALFVAASGVQDLSLQEVAQRYLARVWRCEGNASTLRVRSRYPLLSREVEPPARLAMKWVERHRKTGAFSFDDIVEIGRTLTDAQFSGLESWAKDVSLPLDEVSSIKWNRRAYSLLRALPTQVQAEAESSGTPVAQLSKLNLDGLIEAIRDRELMKVRDLPSGANFSIMLEPANVLRLCTLRLARREYAPARDTTGRKAEVGARDLSARLARSATIAILGPDEIPIEIFKIYVFRGLPEVENGHQ